MADTIREWLAALDLDALAILFEENQVELRDLPLLSEDDLKHIGLALGPRRRILNAIASASTTHQMPIVSPEVRHDRNQAAERRQLTVMFSDLVGSTELSQRFDPEDLRELIRRYQDVVVGATVRYGGHVGNFLGDGVLTYFGWPRAYEDQAERAVRASLEATSAMQDIRDSEMDQLQTRFGIATGQVVVGDIVGEMASDLQAVTGQTPNLAARLQAVAKPGQICVDQTTRQLIGRKFQLQDIGHLVLKGFVQPVPAWQVVAENDVQSIFETDRTTSINPLIGRDHEFERLRENWQRAAAGSGGIICISGEAGIGKSRLAAALSQQLAVTDHIRIRYQCSAYHTDSAFYPIAEHLKKAANFGTTDTADDKLDKLEQLVLQAEDDFTDTARLFAAILSLPYEERYGPVELSAAQRRQRTIEAMVMQIVSLSQKKPLLLLVEDAHWTDPSTELFLMELMVRIAGHAVLVIVTHRPEYELPAPVECIQLERLNQSQSMDVARGIAGADVDSTRLRQVVDRADGNPLYLEELAKDVSEARDVDEVPTSLQASLVARLDRMELSRELLQVGAVIGRSFSHELIVAVMGGRAKQVSRDLANIVRSELVNRHGEPPAVVYSFKHALIRDAAYEILLRSNRRRYHAKVADTLLQQFPEQADSEPGLIALHLSQAKQPSRAIVHWLRAGQQANERSEYLEAITSLENGLADLSEIPDGPERRNTELAIRLALGAALLAVKGWSAPALEENYRQAQHLSADVDNTGKKIAAILGLANVYFLRGEVQKTKDLTGQAIDIAKAGNDSVSLMRCKLGLGMCAFFVGQFADARDLLQQAQSIYDPSKHALQKYAQGTDPGVIILSMLAWTTWFLGDADETRRIIKRALNHAAKLDHPFSLAYAESLAASVFQCCQDPDEVRHHADAAIAIAKEQQYPYWLGWASTMKGWALAATGSPERRHPAAKPRPS